MFPQSLDIPRGRLISSPSVSWDVLPVHDGSSQRTSGKNASALLASSPWCGLRSVFLQSPRSSQQWAVWEAACWGLLCIFLLNNEFDFWKLSSGYRDSEGFMEFHSIVLFFLV